MWLAIEIEDFPCWFDWQQSAFELIQKNLMPISASPRPLTGSSCSLPPLARLSLPLARSLTLSRRSTSRLNSLALL